MDQKQKQNTKSPLPAIVGLAMFLGFASSIAQEGISPVVIAPLFIIVVAVVIAVAAAAAKKNAGSGDQPAHTHDRIDHSTDLRIDSATGRAVNRPQQPVQPHSPREHWKQQLDGLLANGTIDRKEYDQMLRSYKF